MRKPDFPGVHCGGPGDFSWTQLTSGLGHSLWGILGMAEGLSSIPGPYSLDGRSTPGVTATDVPRCHPGSPGGKRIS